ncbi:hypothetical protein HS088_TW09G00341 [Tripterygium wilfordii]|uniref:Uncharacterized protein n=1 Tax=Tripterygium wilfordii TaxID=458696 RepID=A0A7J7D7H4_TRIWF|nr:hypothetical protein HS088_TW09G00341 [Tripterygium wilfordii]
MPTLRSSMALSQQSKICVDVAADNTSCDSLSFTGLVCVQDQKPRNHPKHVKQSDSQDQSFEFSCSAIESLALKSNSNRLSDRLITDLQLLQQQSQPQAKQRRDSSHRSSKGSTPATQMGESTNFAKGSYKPDNKIRNQAVKSTAPSSGLGCKIFQSFMSPCRNVKPDVKAPALQRENIKSH